MSPVSARGNGWHRAVVAAILALALLEIMWEAWLAPLKPGSSWLALKALPLLLLLPAVSRGQLRALQWVLLLLPWYVAEGVVRMVSESSRHALCAALAATLGLLAMTTGLVWIRSRRQAG